MLLLMQLVVEPGIGNAQKSSMAGLPPFLVAGVPHQLAVTARDAQGNLTDSAGQVVVTLDTPTEGVVFMLPWALFFAVVSVFLCICNLEMQI